MRRFLYTTLLLFACLLLQAQPNADLTPQPENNISVTEKTIYHKLGVNIVPIKIQQYGENSDIVFISIHDDEFTSIMAAKKGS